MIRNRQSALWMIRGIAGLAVALLGFSLTAVVPLHPRARENALGGRLQRSHDQCLQSAVRACRTPSALGRRRAR